MPRKFSCHLIKIIKKENHPPSNKIKDKNTGECFVGDMFKESGSLGNIAAQFYTQGMVVKYIRATVGVEVQLEKRLDLAGQAGIEWWKGGCLQWV